VENTLASKIVIVCIDHLKAIYEQFRQSLMLFFDSYYHKSEIAM